jgi:hypothetical protein
VRRSPLFWLILAALGLSVVWYVVTPRRAWERFNRALVTGSESGLEAVIDYPILRDNLKRDLRGAIDVSTQVRAGLPAGDLAGLLIDPMVDAAVTPGGLARLLTGFGMRRDAGAAGEGIFSRAETRFRYRPPSRVDVRVYPEGGSPDDGGIFTFHRSGTTWRLVRIWSDRLARTENPS